MKGFSGKSIHEGEEPDETLHGDVVSPIHLSSTFSKKNMKDVEKGFVYSRSGNPTRRALEKKLAALEGAEHGYAFSSGMAVETTVLLSLLESGDHIIASDDLYSGTRRLFVKVMERFDLKFDFVDLSKDENISFLKDTKMIWLESPTNPLMKVLDIENIADEAHEKDTLVVMDNTFATPYFQRPLELKADVVVHSLTKYISGHSDVVGGAVMVNDETLHQKLMFHQNALGTVLSPFDSYLVMRGIKTLKPRMNIHEKNAKILGEYLEEHRLVDAVYYPGLPSHPQHDLASRQMSGYGGMLSFELSGTSEKAVKFVEALEVFALGESLGGVESLIEVPAVMTHSNMSREERERIGIRDNLIRVSAGIEEIEELIEDMERGFAALDDGRSDVWPVKS